LTCGCTAYIEGNMTGKSVPHIPRNMQKARHELKNSVSAFRNPIRSGNPGADTE